MSPQVQVNQTCIPVLLERTWNVVTEYILIVVELSKMLIGLTQHNQQNTHGNDMSS